jgi:hypothetical protein
VSLKYKCGRSACLYRFLAQKTYQKYAIKNGEKKRKAGTGEEEKQRIWDCMKLQKSQKKKTDGQNEKKTRNREGGGGMAKITVKSQKGQHANTILQHAIGL